MAVLFEELFVIQGDGDEVLVEAGVLLREGLELMREGLVEGHIVNE